MSTEHSHDVSLRRLMKVVYWMVILISLGTLGYRVIEGWDVADCFFMTVITISTVGYGETHALTENGRWFTSGLIFTSLVSMTAWTAMLTSFIVESELSGYFGRRRTLKMIASMKDHTIVCGTGIIARAVIERLARKRVPIVVVDSDEAGLASLKEQFRRIETICGSPTDELNLAKANLLSARHLVAATSSEVNNLLIGITCKDLGENVSVIAESNDFGIANRMRKSGIDEVISPGQLGGDRVAELVLA